MKNILILTATFRCFRSLIVPLFVACHVCMSGCGGSSGGDDNGEQVSGDARSYLIEAEAVRDSCGERLSAVKQEIVLEESSGGFIVDTSLVKLNLSAADGQFKGAFSETNGDCTREYEVTLSPPTSSPSEVTLLSRSNCSTLTCETEWNGVATPVGNSKHLARRDGFIPRVRGENCNPNVPLEVGYRPSLFECNGNAAILLRDDFRNNYSVVVRRNGQFNDRDPNNPSCTTNQCSPYKTQKRMELSDYQVHCLGGSGFSDEYVPVKRISIKFRALIEDPNDTSQFEQYCLTDPSGSFN